MGRRRRRLLLAPPGGQHRRRRELHEFYDALQDGTAGQFLRCRNVAFVTNHGPAGGDPAIVDLVGQVVDREGVEAGAPVYDEPFEYSGTTTGSGGTQSNGQRTLGMYVYAVPPDALGPRPDDTC